MTDLVFDPWLPWPVLAGGAAALLALLALAFVRRMRRGLVWRALAGMCLLAGLAQPLWLRQERTPLENIVLAMVDDSASMALDGRKAARDAALERLRTDIARQPGWRLQTVRVKNSGQGTRLAPVLQQELGTLPGRQLAGVVVVGDGAWPDAAAARKRVPENVPVTALLAGDPKTPDRSVRIGTYPPYGLVGKSLSVPILAEDSAVPAETPLAVTISAENFSTTVTVPNRGSATVNLPVRHAGMNRFLATLPPEPGRQELTLLNNRRLIEIEGVRDRLRVLLVSGLPHTGGRSWRTLFRGDPLVDLVHFTILRPPEIFDPVPQRELALIPFPVDELFSEKVSRFDLIVFDRYARLGVLNSTYFNNIVRYVQNGGGLLVTTGPEALEAGSLFNTPLRRILPVQPPLTLVDREYRPVVTERGHQHPVTAELEPETAASAWGAWQRLLRPATVIGAVVLATPDGQALLTLAEVGSKGGRVAQILTDRIGLWQRGYQGGGPSELLLKNVAHWLMKEPDLDETRLVARLEDGALVARRYGSGFGAATDSRAITFELPDGMQRAVATTGTEVPAARLDHPQPGLYRITSGTLETFFTVGAEDRVESDALATQPRQAAAFADSVTLLKDQPDFTVRKINAWQRGNSRQGVLLHDRAAFAVQQSHERPLLPPLGWGVFATLFVLLGWLGEGRRRSSA